MGVIVSPSQRGKPIYSPFNSYDRRMLDAYFDRYHQTIADLTATTYLGLDIDQELTRYETPRDLLLVRYIVVRSIAGVPQVGSPLRFDGERADSDLPPPALGEHTWEILGRLGLSGADFDELRVKMVI